MASNYWIKLYHEILDDPKMGMLPDNIWRRCIELFLMAGELESDGQLPDTDAIAWRLRQSPEHLQTELEHLAGAGIVEVNEDGWFICKFAERQEPVSGAERVRRHRERKRKQEYYGDNGDNVTPPDEPETPDDGNGNDNVTIRYTDTDTDIDNITTNTPAQELSSYFSQKTGKHPNGIIDSQGWDADSQEIIDKANGDVTRARGLVDEALVILTDLGYPRNKPAGLLVTIDNLLKPKPKRNGASNGYSRQISGKATPESIKLGLERAFKGG